MIKPEDFLEAIAKANDFPRKKTLAEMLVDIYKDKLIEIYLGDEYESLEWDDTSERVIAVICGKVIAAYAELLVIDCAYVNAKTKSLSFGNYVCINERGIRMLTEVGVGNLSEIFLNSKQTKIIRALQSKNEKP